MRGYHAYQNVWTAAVGDQLPCRRERANSEDPFAVAVMKGETIVGHVPRKISSVCSMFLRRGRLIFCRVTGSRRYSGDLPQGGLEVPCVLLFRGNEKDAAKAKELVTAALHPMVDSNQEHPCKKAKICETHVDPPVSQSDEVWVHLNGIRLTHSDKHIINAGEKLSDLHINYAHHLLKHQFPGLKGLQNTSQSSSPEKSIKSR